MHDLAPPPVPTGRHIIQFAQDEPIEFMRSVMEDDIGDRSGNILEHLKIGVVEHGVTDALALSEKEGVLSVRPEFYLFSIQTLNRKTMEWLKSGCHLFLDTLSMSEEPEPDPWPWKEQAARFYDTPEFTWGLQAIGVDRTALSGKNVKVCVLDTGIDSGHPDFEFRQQVARSFCNESAFDGNGHGTHVTGTIAGPFDSDIGRRYGVAPEVELYIGKVLSNGGSGREFDVLRGIEWGISEGCHIISMSLGRAVRRNEKPDPLYEAIGQAALDAGCLIIAAAGNESSRAYGYIAPVGSPANATTIMAVGAVDPLMRASSFSCGASGLKGGEVDIAAPGSNVYSAWPKPRLSQTISGTSMACPHVSGVAALYAQENGVRGRDLWQQLIDGATKLGNIRDFGAGLVHAPSGSW